MKEQPHCPEEWVAEVPNCGQSGSEGSGCLAPAAGRVTGWQPSCRLCRSFICWGYFSLLTGSACCVLPMPMERQEKISVCCLPLTTGPIFCSLPLSPHKAVKYFDVLADLFSTNRSCASSYCYPSLSPAAPPTPGLVFSVSLPWDSQSAGMPQPREAAGAEDRDLGAVWFVNDIFVL